MQPQHFQIEDFELTKAGIVVDVVKAGIMIPVTIPESEFEWFLKINDKLDWEYNHSDHAGNHQQGTGKMSMDEYWATDKKFIRDDLYSFIVSHPIQRTNETIWQDSIKSLTVAFDLHLARKRNREAFQERWDSEQDLTSIIN